MYFQYLQKYWVAGKTALTWIQTDDFSSNQPGQGNYFAFPQASYIEFTYRDNIYDNHTPCDGVNSVAFVAWSHEGAAGVSSVNEFDLIENWGSGVNCQSQVTGESLHNFNGDGSGGVPGGRVWDFSGLGNFGRWGYGSTDSYHTYGMLTTTDGTTIEVCGYIDHALVNCAPFPRVDRECVDSLNQSGCFGQKNILYLWVGSNNGQRPHGDIKAWVQSWRVWSCPSWNATDPKISNPPTNTCYGKIITSQNAAKGDQTKFANMNENERKYLLSKFPLWTRATMLTNTASGDPTADENPPAAPMRLQSRTSSTQIRSARP
jgi:hypothetical protein